ncbi:MAG: DUF3313 domain-containing protein [Planctomycetota bacterium]|jgi:hypothetical protein
MNKLFLIPTALGLLLFTACGTTQPEWTYEDSSFLNDYSMLEDSGGNDPLLMYRNPDADFRYYDKVLLEPPSIWRPAESPLGEINDEDAKLLCKYLYLNVKKQINKKYELAREPGPGVIRLQLAITEASDSMEDTEMLAMVVPVGIPIAASRQLRTDTAAFVRATSLEGKFTDSETGELLFAAVDRWVDSKSVDGYFSSWADVKEAYYYWAQDLKKEIDELR